MFSGYIVSIFSSLDLNINMTPSHIDMDFTTRVLASPGLPQVLFAPNIL